MADSKDFRGDIQRIGGLVQEIESIADPAVRATAKDMVQSLMDLHGAGLNFLNQAANALDVAAKIFAISHKFLSMPYCLDGAGISTQELFT